MSEISAEVISAVKEIKSAIIRAQARVSAKPEEIAQTVLWLCSHDAGFVIGQAITVDGGFTVK